MLEDVHMEAKYPTHHHPSITNLSYTKILPEMPSRARTQCINKPVIESHSIKIIATIRNFFRSSVRTIFTESAHWVDSVSKLRCP